MAFHVLSQGSHNGRTVPERKLTRCELITPLHHLSKLVLSIAEGYLCDSIRIECQWMLSWR